MLRIKTQHFVHEDKLKDNVEFSSGRKTKISGNVVDILKVSGRGYIFQEYGINFLDEFWHKMFECSALELFVTQSGSYNAVRGESI